MEIYIHYTGIQTMRIAAFLSLWCWAAAAPAVNPWVDTRHARETVTVDFLYETCSVVGETAHGMIPFFDCESYVYGVLDGYVAVRDALPAERRACFPADMPPWRALQEAEPLLDKKQGAAVAGPALIAALSKKYPCK